MGDRDQRAGRAGGRVSRALEWLDGVTKVEMRFEQGEFAVRYDPARVGAPRMLETIRKMGFRPAVAGVGEGR